ncbi:MAG TPA: hypothetical protein VIJ30_10050 [Candidatus Dormibacteraeota bacterium]
MQPKPGDSSFDFWLGKWVTRWKDAAGHGHKGSNVVLKLGRSVHMAHRVPAR